MKDDLDEILWEFKAIRARIFPKTIIEKDQYHYNLRFDRSNVDAWIIEQKKLKYDVISNPLDEHQRNS